VAGEEVGAIDGVDVEIEERPQKAGDVAASVSGTEGVAVVSIMKSPAAPRAGHVHRTRTPLTRRPVTDRRR
jgi:hypothetical protein